MNAKIRFQNVHEAQQFALLEPLLLEVIQCALEVWPGTFDVNEIARGPSDANWKPSSWHCQPPPFRALDAKTQGVMTPAAADKIVQHIHSRFIYDPGRPEKPVALVHDPFHMHLQTHPLTARI